MGFSNITLLALVCLLLHSHTALGHTYLSSIQIDGTNLAEGDCVRPHPAVAKENPIPLVTQAVCDQGRKGKENEGAGKRNMRKCTIISLAFIKQRVIFSYTGYDMWVVTRSSTTS